MIRKIAFLGTPEISRATLRLLFDSGFEIPLVVTGADKKRGRGSTLTPSPVGVLARELGLRVSHDPADLLMVDFDLAVVVAYGKLISQSLLDKGPFINLHFSLLPRWRGAAPIERAILAGDKETGVCVMKLVKELDAGPIYQQRKVLLGDEVAFDDLSIRLSELANEALSNELAKGARAFGLPIEQKGEPVYAHKLSVDDLRIIWSEGCQQTMRKVRLGRAWTTLNGKRFRIISAGIVEDDETLAPGELRGTTVGTGDGVIGLWRVQPANKGVMEAQAWINGVRHTEKIFFL